MDSWNAGGAYENYVGRWSAPVAREFIGWIAPDSDMSWLEVGCGTGALTQAILDIAAPARILATDPSHDYLEFAAERLGDDHVTLQVAEATKLPSTDEDFDAIVSGLVLNFVSNSDVAIAEMRRAVRPGGLVAAYVWDYLEGMQFIRRFWDAAVALDPSAAALDEARRFPLCGPEPLRRLLAAGGLKNVEVGEINIETRFRDFDDFWQPFLSGQGPAPGNSHRFPTTGAQQLPSPWRPRCPMRATAPYRSSRVPGPFADGARHRLQVRHIRSRGTDWLPTGEHASIGFGIPERADVRSSPACVASGCLVQQPTHRSPSIVVRLRKLDRDLHLAQLTDGRLDDVLRVFQRFPHGEVDRVLTAEALLDLLDAIQREGKLCSARIRPPPSS